MKQLEQRADQILKAQVRKRLREAVRSAEAELPDALVERDDDMVAITGRNLLRRWLQNASLRDRR